MKKPTKIILAGVLGKEFTPELDLFVDTPKEVINALRATFPNFASYILSNPDQLYKMIVRGRGQETNWEVAITENNNLFPCSGKEVVIAPVAAGSGGILRGIVLLGIGIATGGIGLIIAGALALGQALFFGSPDKPDPEEDAKQSLVFTGQTTTTAEGNKISIICGNQYRVGVQIISFAIKSEFTHT